jgi:raffinose/stachyose/melibiose transport system substrate-binding protein
VVNAYERFQKWINNGWVVPDFLTVSPDDSRWPWYQGEAAMILEGIWYERNLKDDEQDLANFDFFLPPTEHEPLRYSAFPEQLMIAKDSKHPDEAAAFINFWVNPETQQKYVELIGARTAVAGIKPDCEEWPLTCKWRDILSTSQEVYPPTDQAFVKELMDGFFEVQDNIVAGKLTPEEGAKLMQQRVEEFKASQAQ